MPAQPSAKPGPRTWPGANLAQQGWRLLKRLATVKSGEPQLGVGLDIGSTAIKVVAWGPRNAFSAKSAPSHHLVPLGEAAESKLPEAIQEAVRALNLPVKAATLSVSGQWVIMRIIEMPPLKPQELAQALPFEAQRHLPFNIQDVVLDGVALGAAEGNKVWVLLVACKRDLLERRISAVKQAGLEPSAVDVDALALVSAFVGHSNGRKLSGTHALINVGAQGTNLALLKNDVPYLIRDIPWGAKTLIRHVAEQLKIEEQAVASQLQQGGSLAAEFVEAMKGACELLTAELQLSFDFFESRFAGPPPDQLLVSGGLSQCSSFLEALKGHLPQPPMPWMAGTGLSDQFAVAYGLALRMQTP
jgi:type IV pilus assembly protein PilM